MKNIYKITFAILVGLFIAATAQARGYVIAEGGNCVTVEFHYDNKGNSIGTSTQTGKCNIPDGVYPFNLVIQNTGSSSPIPLNPTTMKSLPKKDSFYTTSLQVLEVVRKADANSSRSRNQTITIPHEYALLIEEALKNRKEIAISVPRAYLSNSMVERLQKGDTAVQIPDGLQKN